VGKRAGGAGRTPLKVGLGHRRKGLSHWESSSVFVARFMSGGIPGAIYFVSERKV
jgi:hypothetical protein